MYLVTESMEVFNMFHIECVSQMNTSYIIIMSFPRMPFVLSFNHVCFEPDKDFAIECVVVINNLEVFLHNPETFHVNNHINNHDSHSVLFHICRTTWNCYVISLN